jgi:hypothetical protein
VGIGKRLVSAALVAVIAISCAAIPIRRPVNKGMSNPVLRTMLLHADMGFKPEERTWISVAINNIEEQSAGTLHVVIDYDLNFDSTVSIVSHAHDDLLVRAPQDAPYVTYEDTQTSKLLGVVAGVDLDNYSTVAPKRIYLVADRLWTVDVFEHVTMHEILHAFGLRHTDDVNGVMYFSVLGSHPSLCIGRADAEELCRVAWCLPDTLNYCQ